VAAYEPRHYRVRCRPDGLVAFTARVKETDLWILARQDLTPQATEAILDLRRGLELYIRDNPGFLQALTPWREDPLAPPLVREMIAAGRAVGAGPMAAVAGAIAQAVGRRLKELSPQVVVENGGDVFLDAGREVTVAVDAGPSPLSGRLGIRVAAQDMPLCVCTSSATVGHSLSLGRADAATVAAPSGALADAAATMLGNRVAAPQDLEPALRWVSGVEGVRGAVVVLGERLAAWGELELVDLAGKRKGKRRRKRA
jgi:hypothetical protein